MALRYMNHLSVFGIRCPKVGISTFYYPSLGVSLRGAVALSAIRRGEIFCRVPEEALVSDLSVARSSFWPMVKRGIDTELLLALFVIRESARRSSRHMPYIRAVFLQHEWRSLPVLWDTSSRKFQALSSGTQKIVRSHKRGMRNLYNSQFPQALTEWRIVLSEGFSCIRTLCNVSYLHRLYSERRVLRTLAIIKARDWGLPIRKRARQFLAPVMDILNFGQMGIRMYFDDTTSEMVARTQRDVQAGKELLFYYGGACKDQMLAVYGFSSADVPSAEDHRLTRIRSQKDGKKLVCEEASGHGDDVYKKPPQ
eukprot:CAMPEP_0119313238 /NCGR_PEP_ID=MMETSP1333-20130426/28458_1 /TAXON_ID=418940 /ORGANISM="Scyphosphaera apsteinii, Strain RCC1455" /LENGTH=309 /DNA_ID=CAMNT_0007318033 /DNA_START=50 /DNA_END=980 /DNA_ORIENTATION=-